MSEIIRHTDVRLSWQNRWQRREFLRWLPVAAAAGSLSWHDRLSAQAADLRRRGKSCILLWMAGGPSQFETFSPLPNHDNGGETKAIATNTPGIQIASTLPNTAKMIGDICVIRSMTSKEGSHARASFLLQTGYLPNPSVKHPSFGAVTAERLGDAAAELPSFVSIGRQRGNVSARGGLLGVEYDPLQINNPARPPENTRLMTTEGRFQRRLDLMESMNRAYAKRGLKEEAADQTKIYRKAAKMILSPEMRAFDLDDEPASMRTAYGDTPFGNGCLLARRLIESGVTFVEVNLGNWDTHQDNFNATASLCGQLDAPYAQLIADLKQRGRLEDTLVIWMGEFGRTPRVNVRAGRDHYPRAFTVALAGGGVRGGQVIGRLDQSGAEVVDRPVGVPDLFQTFCHSLGMDPDHENVGPSARPIKIVETGSVVQEVFG